MNASVTAPPPPSPARNAVVQAAAVVVFAAWVYPSLLDRVGLHALARWMTASALHRVALMPVLLALAMVTHTSKRGLQRAERRTAWRPFADAIGGELVEAPEGLAHGQWTGGPTVRSSLPGGRVVYEVVRERDRWWTRVRATVGAADGLALQLIGPGPGRVVSQRLLRPLMGLALSATTARLDDPRERAALQSLGFLTGPEISTGEPDLDGRVSLRANDPEAARRLLAAAGVSGALHDLAARAVSWQWSVLPQGSTAESQVEFRLPGTEADLDSLLAAHALMAAVLDHFASSRRTRAAS